MTLKLPRTFVTRYEKLADDPEAFFESMLTLLPKSLRVNTLKANSGLVEQRFAKYGIKLQRVEWYEDAFVSDNPAIASTVEHSVGAIYIQELTSMLPPLLIRDELDRAKSVLDACAAPGSKTTQLAALMNNRGTIVANDVEYERIKPLKSNLERCGALNTVITNMNLLNFPDSEFDLVLLDAPCSSEGTIRRGPKQIFTWSLKRIPAAAARQKQLIIKAFDLLKPGGTMIYSTCTFAPEENEGVIDFLLQNRQAFLKEIDVSHLQLTDGITEWEKAIYDPRVKKCKRVFPHHNDTGGFFLAKITK
jgi:NOL1/NOP2/sun family putative RNA methylase